MTAARRRAEAWTPERIAADRRVASSQKWLAALDEIERLQARVAEYRAEMSEQDATIALLQARLADCQCGKFPVHLTAERFQKAIEAEEANQRREQLLRDRIIPALESLDEDDLGHVQDSSDPNQWWCVRDELIAAIRAELGDAG